MCHIVNSLFLSWAHSLGNTAGDTNPGTATMMNTNPGTATMMNTNPGTMQGIPTREQCREYQPGMMKGELSHPGDAGRDTINPGMHERHTPTRGCMRGIHLPGKAGRAITHPGCWKGYYTPWEARMRD